MANSGAVDEAIVAALLADTGTGSLAQLCPDGVYFDVAREGKTKFVLVSLVISEDAPALNEETAFEEALYLVKAVIKGSDGANIRAAAQRIYDVLHNQPLTITGYHHMVTRRRERVRVTEIDDQDATIRWQHRGGRYEVFVSPIEE